MFWGSCLRPYFISFILGHWALQRFFKSCLIFPKQVFISSWIFWFPMPTFTVILSSSSSEDPLLFFILTCSSSSPVLHPHLYSSSVLHPHPRILFCSSSSSVLHPHLYSSPVIPHSFCPLVLCQTESSLSESL